MFWWPSPAKSPSMPIAFRPRLPRRARTRRAVVAPAAERTQPQIERISHAGLEWLHIEEPSALERAWLVEHYDFHPLDLEDVMSRNQRPKIDEYPEYLFIVLHFPIFDKQVGRLNAGELDLFVGPDYVITLPNQPLKPVEYLFERCPRQRGVPRAALLEGLRATCSTRSSTSASTTASRCCARSGTSSSSSRRTSSAAAPRRSCATSPTRSRRSSTSARSSARSARCCATSSAPSSATGPRSWRSTSTTSSTPPSGSGTCSRTTRRSWRRSRTPTSR